MIPYSVERTLLGKHRVVYDCPHCGHNIYNPLEEAGIDDVCPECDGDFVVPGVDDLERITQEEEKIRLKDDEKAVARSTAKTESNAQKKVEREAARLEKARQTAEQEARNPEDFVERAAIVMDQFSPRQQKGNFLTGKTIGWTFKADLDSKIDARLYKKQIIQAKKDLRLILRDMAGMKREWLSEVSTNRASVGHGFFASFAYGLLGRRFMGISNASGRRAVAQTGLGYRKRFDQSNKTINHMIFGLDKTLAEIERRLAK